MLDHLGRKRKWLEHLFRGDGRLANNKIHHTKVDQNKDLMFTYLNKISHMKHVHSLILKVIHFFFLRTQIDIS